MKKIYSFNSNKPLLARLFAGILAVYTSWGNVRANQESAPNGVIAQAFYFTLIALGSALLTNVLIGWCVDKVCGGYDWLLGRIIHPPVAASTTPSVLEGSLKVLPQDRLKFLQQIMDEPNSELVPADAASTTPSVLDDSRKVLPQDRLKFLQQIVGGSNSELAPADAASTTPSVLDDSLEVLPPAMLTENRLSKRVRSSQAASASAESKL